MSTSTISEELRQIVKSFVDHGGYMFHPGDRIPVAIEEAADEIDRLKAELRSVKGSLNMLRLGIDEASRMDEERRVAEGRPS